jgi:serine/threonine protein kinase
MVPLREGPDFTLYRGRQHGNPSSVLAVALSSAQPSPQSVRLLEHEYSLAGELDEAWAARPLTLTRHAGQTILVLTDPGGEPLDRVLERHKEQPLDLTRFLRIAIGLATALGHVHRKGIIHKDIKPANVLVDDDGKVWLTGFGIASQLPHEAQSPAPPEIIAGTLAYMAPEQTGRMNRSMDAAISTRWPWPGNVRELQNIIERAVIRSIGFVLKLSTEELHLRTDTRPLSKDGNRSLRRTLEDAERREIVAALEKTMGKVGGPNGAAALLGMSRSTLLFRMQKLSISASRVIINA